MIRVAPNCPPPPVSRDFPGQKKQQALPLRVGSLFSSLLLICFILFRLEHAGA